jgi:ADP-heptose:LPS heptosyltransferase
MVCSATGIFPASFEDSSCKPSSLGDVVQALPVARLLRRHLPHAEIHWWLNRELTPLLEHDPDIRRVIPFDRKRWGTPAGRPSALLSIRELPACALRLGHRPPEPGAQRNRGAAWRRAD